MDSQTTQSAAGASCFDGGRGAEDCALKLDSSFRMEARSPPTTSFREEASLLNRVHARKREPEAACTVSEGNEWQEKGRSAGLRTGGRLSRSPCKTRRKHLSQHHTTGAGRQQPQKKQLIFHRRNRHRNQSEGKERFTGARSRDALSLEVPLFCDPSPHALP